MSVIPVLDLMIGQIVLAQGGQRDAYRPVHSRLTTSSEPLDVARAMFAQTGCDCLYLADIDSFSGASPNWPVFNQLVNHGFQLWIDADWFAREHYLAIGQSIDQPQQIRPIVSSETMAGLEELSAEYNA